MASRSLTDLHPAVQARANRWLDLCQQAGLDILVYCTYRSWDEQEAEYAKGRTAPGPVVTWARGGDSWHQHRCALDFVPLRNGRPVWGTKGADLALWNEAGRLAKFCGFEWAGDWPRPKTEFPHIQYTGGLTISQAKSGSIPV